MGCRRYPIFWQFSWSTLSQGPHTSGYPTLARFSEFSDAHAALQEMAEEDEKQRKVEEEFAAEVWNHAGRKVSESVVGFLGASAELNQPAVRAMIIAVHTGKNHETLTEYLGDSLCFGA